MPTESPLVEVKDLCVSFRLPGREVEAVRGVSWTMTKGEIVALVGESGSGKSVTALSILQLLHYPVARHPRGSIRVGGTEMVGANDATLRGIRGNRVGMIFQEPMTSLNPLHTIGRQIAETLLLHQRMTEAQARVRTLELLVSVGMEQAAHRLEAFPHEFSGGQRQRIMIAMALANNPDLLIADEPTTALDVTVQAQILKLIKELQGRTGMAVLLITHDLAIVRKVADRVLVMMNGEIVEAGTTGEVFTRPRHAYTQSLLASRLAYLPNPAPPDAPVVMAAEDVKVHFPVKSGWLRRTVSHIKAVDGVSVEVREGRTLGVVGESGSGKTTLALALLRLQSSQGSIRFNKRDLQHIDALALRSLRRNMQIVFQDPFGSLNPRFSVEQIIGEGLRAHGLDEGQNARRAVIAEGLSDVGLNPEMMDRYPHEFSGGQRQRIAIARAMVLKPRLVMLDEPTSSLDVSTQAQILRLLRDLQIKHRVAYVMISHNLEAIRAICEDIAVMYQGRVVEYGPASKILDHPETNYTKALMKAAFEIEASE